MEKEIENVPEKNTKKENIYAALNFFGTVLGLGFLFVGTCFPLGMITFSNSSFIYVLAYIVIFLLACIILAIHTQRKERRWGIILVIASIGFFFSLLLQGM